MSVLSEHFTAQVRKTPLFTADEEHALAVEIWEARREVWRGLFQDPTAVAVALAQDTKTCGAQDMADSDCDEVVLAQVLEALEKQGHAPTLAAARENVTRMHTLIQRFARANIGLVMRAAVRGVRGAGRELGYQDTFSEGVCGLMKAVRRFDPWRGTRFSTFAMWWIRHAINRAIQDKARTVRIPCHARGVAAKIARESNAFEARHGRLPDEAHLAEQIGISEKKVRNALRISLAPAISLDPVLTQHTEDDTHAHPIARLADESPLAEDLLEREESYTRLAQALEHLSPTARDIVERRYGLRGGRKETLKEIGELHALSRERIRQIENIALAKLGTLLRPQAH